MRGPSASSAATMSAPFTKFTSDMLDNLPSEGSDDYSSVDDDYFDDEHCTLFVGDVARSLTEEDITSIFSKYGEVVNVEIKRDKVKKISLGYAFVQFKSRDEAKTAKYALHKTVVANRPIRIGWAQKNTNLYVGDLDPSVTDEDLRAAFRKFGDLMESDTFVKKLNYGFVRFVRRTDAETAKKEMDGKILGGRRIRIGWGEANTQKYCVHLQFDTMDIGALDAVTEDGLLQIFSEFGNVVNIHLPRSGPHLKGFAFIRYNDTDEGEKSAADAIDRLNNTEISGVAVQCNFGKKQSAKKKPTTSKTKEVKKPMRSNTWPQGERHFYPSEQQQQQQQQQSQQNPYMMNWQLQAQYLQSAGWMQRNFMLQQYPYQNMNNSNEGVMPMYLYDPYVLPQNTNMYFSNNNNESN